MDIISNDQAGIAKQERFANVWAIFEEYNIINGIVNPVGLIRKMYSPIGCKNIPNELAQLYKYGNDTEIIKFYKSYGMLGRNYFEDQPKKDRGETLDWIYAHSKTIDICITIDFYLKEMSNEQREEFTEEQFKSIQGKQLKSYLSQFEKSKLYYFYGLAVKSKISKVLIIPYTNNIFETARNIRRELINNNINGIYRCLEYDNEKKQETSIFSFVTLIEVIYWILADKVIGGTVKECTWCKRPFIQTHKLQKCCPISEYTKLYNPKIKDSPCAVALRQDRKRHPNKYK